MLRTRLIGMLVAALTAAAGIPLLLATPAHAAAYRYWSYWHGDSGGWTFSQVGAGGWRVADGSVEGWHFAVSPNTRSAPPPRYGAVTAFTALCGSTPKPAGKVRVALVLDFGVAADYPDGDGPPDPALVGDCITVPASSTGIAVLNTAEVSVRDQAGLVCALAGHPATGCGEFVADPTPTPTSVRPTRKPRPTVSPAPGRTRTPAPGAPADPASVAPTPAVSGGRTHQPAPTPTTTSTPVAVAVAGSTAPSGPEPVAAATGDTAAPDASPTLAVGMPVASTTGTGTPWPALAVLAIVAGLGGAAYWWRRRSS